MQLTEQGLPQHFVDGPYEDQQRWLGKFVDDTAYDLLLNKTGSVVRGDGRVLCVLIKNGLSPAAGLAMYKAVRERITSTDNRGHASGFERIRRTLKNNTISNSNRTDQTVQSSVMGFFDRYPRFPFCRKTAFVEKYPESFAACLPALQQSSQLFAKHAPAEYANQLAICQKTSQDFVIPGTVFTTITLNRNFRTACHRDAGDYPDGFGVMSYFRGGRFKGGRLVFPEYRVAVELNSYDVILFDPHELHGNTAIVPLNSSPWERITCVHYYRKNMIYCGSAAQELAIAKAHDPRVASRRLTVGPGGAP